MTTTELAIFAFLCGLVGFGIAATLFAVVMNRFERKRAAKTDVDRQKVTKIGRASASD